MPRMSKKFKEANTRRHELIDKKYDCGLTEDEEAEYAGLQKFTAEYLEKKFPRCFEGDEDMSRLDAILKRIKEKKGITDED